MLAALCSRLMAGNRFLNAVRLVLGLEITRILLSLAEELWRGVLEWS